MRQKSEEERPESVEPEPSRPRLVEAPRPVRDAPAPQGSPPPATAAESPGPAPYSPPPRPGRGRGLRLLLVFVLIVAAGAGYGAYWWTVLRGTVSTDDAYVDARIISVAARLSERVDVVNAREGDVVQAGQPLATFSRDKLNLRVREAAAEMHSAEAALAEARNATRPEEIQVAQAEVRVREVDLDLQEKELRRAMQLAEVRAISAQELERRRAAVAAAHSQLQVSKHRLSLIKAGSRAERIQIAEAALALARARLQSAEADLRDTQLNAPTSGIVARLLVDAGEVVQQGQALFQIVEIGNTWVVANLEEDQIGVVKEGQPVRLWVDAYPGREFKGRVGPLYAATLSRFSLLPSSSASGSFIKVTQRVPVRIEWAEAGMPPVYPGLNVVVRITVEPR